MLISEKLRNPENLLLAMAFIMPLVFSVWMAMLNNFVIEQANFTGIDPRVPCLYRYLCFAIYKRAKASLTFTGFNQLRGCSNRFFSIGCWLIPHYGHYVRWLSLF